MNCQSLDFWECEGFSIILMFYSTLPLWSVKSRAFSKLKSGFNFKLAHDRSFLGASKNKRSFNFNKT